MQQEHLPIDSTFLGCDTPQPDSRETEGKARISSGRPHTQMTGVVTKDVFPAPLAVDHQYRENWMVPGNEDRDIAMATLEVPTAAMPCPPSLPMGTSASFKSFPTMSGNINSVQLQFRCHVHSEFPTWTLA